MTGGAPPDETDRVTRADAAAPSAGRRALAAVALLAAAALAVTLVAFVLGNLVWVVVVLAGIAVAVAGGWWTITERLPRRAVGVAGLVGGAAVAALAVVEAVDTVRTAVVRVAVTLAVLAVAALSGRAAMAPDLRELDRVRSAARLRPLRPVLLCNPWSGGGKVARFGLAELARDMGVEVVALDEGLDLAELARAAIARGADCLGMAGGDGSQALVASIAHQHDVPFVCIPAGTRNHFAQDLGFDKEDPRKGMAAFRDGVERFIDYGTVGGRLFVNNVSMGVYATIVRREGYRGAKIETAREMLPELLSHRAEPFDLQFTTPGGVEIADAFVVQVSNNPYVWGASPDFAQRRAMDSGRLGVFAVDARNGREAAEIVTRALTGLARGDRYFHEFTATTFEVRSRSGRAFAGIDGEALELDTPLEFRIHPRGLRMLVPEDVAVAAERRRARGFSPGALLAVARGRRPAALAARVPPSGEGTAR